MVPVPPTSIRLDDDTFEGRNNAYLLDGATTTLIDTGVATAPVRDQLAEGLATAGVGPGDVDRVLVTHWHADHAGLASVLAAEGARVHAGRADVPLVARRPDAEAALEDRYAERFADWGMPAAAREELEAFLDATDELAGRPVDVAPVDPGETIPAGDGHIEAVSLPGHTAGQCGAVIDGPENRVLFAGDALLPRYTPNVGGADVRLERPLATYLDTLARIATGGYDHAWPGHRERIDDPAARAAAVAAHHRERAERVRDVVARAEGPVDAWTVSARLFGDLQGIHLLHGPGEADAHLSHLATAGILEREDRDDGSVGYGLVDADDPDLDASFPPIATEGVPRE